MAGKYIVFEGIEHCGKSTISKIISDRLVEDGYKCMLTGHPGSTDIGQEIRRLVKHTDVEIDPYTEQLLIMCDHSSFVNTTLKTALKNDIISICDRSNLISGYAYGLANGNGLDDIIAQHKSVINITPKIDLLVVFNLPWKIAKTRAKKEVVDGVECRIESRGDNFFKMVEHNYSRICDTSDVIWDLSLRKLVKEIKVIDASRPAENVFEDCLKEIKSIL